MRTLSKNLYFVVFVALYAAGLTALHAQVAMQGHIKDANGTPLPYVNALLITPKDSTLVQGAITDDNGNFTFPEVGTGTYLFKASMLGFQTAFYGPFEVTYGSGHYILPDVDLAEASEQLSEVVLAARKPLYTRKTDRTIINVNNGILNAGSSILSVLEKSPGIQVNRQSGSIVMNGKQGVLLIINGQETRMPMDAIVQMLDGMSSENIENIELITSPPASYDAAGNAGIIQINTKKAEGLGTNGNVGLTGGFNKAETYGANFNINHRSERFNLFADYSILNDKNEHSWQLDRQTRGEQSSVVHNTSQRFPMTTVQNAQAGFSFHPNEGSGAKFILTAYHRDWDLDATSENNTFSNPGDNTFTQMNISESNIWQSATANFGLWHQFGEGRKLSADFDYLLYDNKNPSEYAITTAPSENPDNITDTRQLRLNKSTPISFGIGKIDYTHKLSEKLAIETGVKQSLSRFDNRVKVEELNNGVWEEDPDFSSISELDERIFSSYLSLDWDITAVLHLKGGLRYEKTRSLLESGSGETLVDRNFGKLFPSLVLSGNTGETSKWSLAYYKRITRPTYNEMAPFVFFAGPNTFIAGNLSIKPAISHGFGLDYTLDGWQFSANYNHSPNSIAFFQPEVDVEKNELIFRSQNLEYMNTLGFSLGTQLRLTPWWDLQPQLALNNRSYRTQHLQQNISDKVSSLELNVNSSIRLDDWHTIELSGDYQSASIWGITRFDPMGSLNLGIRKTLKNNWGSLTANLTDMFNTAKMSVRTDIPEANIHSHSLYNYNGRSLTIAYRRSFGNKNVRNPELKSGAEEERKRVN